MKNPERIQTAINKKPPGIVALAWIIIAETIIEFGVGMFESLSYLRNPNNHSNLKIFILLYAVGLAILKILIAIGFLKGKNLARWSWVVFGLALFGLSTLQEQIGIEGGLNIFAEIMKWFWIGTLFFLFKKDMNSYFTASPLTEIK